MSTHLPERPAVVPAEATFDPPVVAARDEQIDPLIDPAEAGIADDADQSGTQSPRGRRPLLPSLAITSLVLIATYAGLVAVLLPNQVAGIDPVNKVSNLAIVTSVSFICTLFAQPIVGAFSDRTRSRMGRRAPWMVIGTAIAAALLIGLGSLTSIIWITVFWAIIQVSLNAMQGPFSAIVPDRFARSKRGAASAMVGVGTTVGATAGVIAAGALAAQFGIAYAGFGIAVLVVTLLFVVFNRDFSSKNLELAPFRWKVFFAGFWIDPRKHPDFAWAFSARFLFILGYWAAFTYQLFILTDYIHLSLSEANADIGLLAVASLVTTVVSVPLGGLLSDKLGRRKIFIYLASLFMIVGLLMPLLLPSLTGMILMSLVLGFGYGLYQSCDTALMTEVLPGGGVGAGKDLGILNVATNVPQALSPILAAVLIGTSFGYPALFVFAMICVAVAALVIIPIRSVR
ncbi:MFS transporter [Subtercola lobariae]|uniref:MFS transporter n=1 Tax=Subtercola lobariae TaxID=1588641 RepID=A0A917BG51_9MICO|nr:MFS transporter [Subtercola lobariae]GGF39296.1 MFS transporter [Subtercola lobariae]